MAKQAIKYSHSGIFEDLDKIVRTVCTSPQKKLIITGLPGSGKSYLTKKILQEYFGKDEIVMTKGYTTVKEMYRKFVLAKVFNKTKAVVYDDCDSVFDDKNGVEILKGLMDTSNDPVSYSAQGSVFPMEDVTFRGRVDWGEFDRRLEAGKLPNEIIYDKIVVIISNKTASQLDSAILSRCLHIDVSLTNDHMLERIEDCLPVMEQHVPINLREEVFNVMSSNRDKFSVINMRTFVKAVNIALVNDDWENLILNYA
jgi:GTPase SAR1 family protein